MSDKYVVDNNKNLVEGLSKEETYDLLAKAINDKTLPDFNTDSAFITQVKDSVTGLSHKVAFVTQAKYNELKNANSLISNCIYYITDDSTEADIENAINQAKEEAIASANATTAEGLAEKLDKGTMQSSQAFNLTDANTNGGAVITGLTLSVSSLYMCWLYVVNIATNYQSYYYLGVLNTSARTHAGCTTLMSKTAYHIELVLEKELMKVFSDTGSLYSQGNTFYYIVVRKIASD